MGQRGRTQALNCSAFQRSPAKAWSYSEFGQFQAHRGKSSAVEKPGDKAEHRMDGDKSPTAAAVTPSATKTRSRRDEWLDAIEIEKLLLAQKAPGRKMEQTANGLRARESTAAAVGE